MKRLIFALAILCFFCMNANAQRKTDNLDRGLVVVQTGSSGSSTTNLLTWRRLANEYFDVTYNVYKDGTKVASNLTTTSYSVSGNSSNQYQVAAVVKGVEQTKCTAVKAWPQYVYKYDVRCPTGYLDIVLSNVYDRNGNDVTSHYQNNDAEFADLDGDGQLEMIIKRINTTDDDDLYLASNTTEYSIFDVYDVNWQTGAATRMWWIDLGPNMVSGSNTEQNIIAYDWDEDGKAEVVLRGADNMIIHKSDGSTYLIGSSSVNTRNSVTHTANMTYTNTGNEYLIYLNGQTGNPYQVTTYPLTRESASAWGDNYGHRSSKYFMGAPYLDGRKPSLFLGRGIYTRHKMCAMDLNRSSHQWTQTWTWACNNSGSPWYGNGYHNYLIADVDEDGRDEIVYGSMVIDDNGKGLSTSGFGHGDAQHVSDFNPYRKGLEFFGCLEENPYWGSNYRDATTSEVLWKHTNPDGEGKTGDDGRCLMANFTNGYPGSQGRSVASSMMSSVTNGSLSVLGDFIAWSDLNFRIYWDGDLCSEILNSPGTEGNAKVDKPGVGRLFTSSDCNMNSWTKNVPCFQGDLIGDWREEIVLRCGQNVRVYTTGMETSYNMPSLWFDHQYRQAMVWQMHAYNQPPHVSYFLGELEGYTVAPPPYTMQGRTEIGNGGSISSTHNDKQLLMAETGNMTISVSDGAAPWVLIDNAPSWVQGTDVNGTSGTKVKTDGNIGASNLPAINRTYYTHTLTGGALTGCMHMVKQGDGILKMASNTHTYTGNTQIWAGTLEFDGTLSSSPVWMNRFTTLNTNGGTFGGGIESLYASTITPGGEGSKGDITTTMLTMNYGARLQIDVFGNNITADHVNVETLAGNSVSGENWETYGPEYLKPVLEFVPQGTLADGMYLLGTMTNEADFTNFVVEGLDNYTYELVWNDGSWYLKIGTGVAVECPAPEIARTSWNETDLNVYYPTVSITNNTFSYNGNTVTPNLSAVFTALDGTETAIDNTLFFEDFEGSTTSSDYWVNNNNSYIFTPTYTNSDGQCIGMQSSADRGDWTRITADYDGVMNYNIEFDAYFNNASKTTNFVVMSESHLASWQYNWGYNYNSSSQWTHNPYLFYMMRGEGSTTFTINEDASNTVTLANSTWYHFTLSVDASAGTVGYSISPKGSTDVVTSGSYTLPDGESAYCDGIYVRNGRYNYAPGGAGIDNIYVYKTSTTTNLYAQNYESATDASSWTNGGGTLELVTGDATYGNYIHHNMGTIAANRSMYTLFATDLSDVDNYTIDFDAYITAGNTANRSATDFVVMSKGAVIPTNRNVGYGYNGDKCNAAGTNYLYRMTAANSQDFTINETTAVSISKAWIHYNIVVNQVARTASYTLTQGTTVVASGTFSIPSGTSTEAYGIFVLDGRGYGDTKIDNIYITSTKEATDLSTYTFTEPGTLTVTASYDGCMSSSTSYTSEIGAKVGTLGYSTLNYQLASLDFSKSGLELYKVAVDSDKKNVTTTLVSDGILPQGTAGLIKGTAGEIFASEIVTNASDWAGNDLIPTTETVYGNGNIYVLNTGASGVGFYMLNDTGTVTVGRGYLEISGITTKALSMFDDDTPTGIIGVNDDEADRPIVIYDLSGRRVTKPGKGIYIVNGKKVVIK